MGWESSTVRSNLLRSLSSKHVVEVCVSPPPPLFHLSRKEPIDKVLAKILKYSEYYWQFIHSKSPYPKSNAVLARLNLLEMSVLNPYLLELMNYAAQGNISDNKIEGVLKSIENYLFRRWVCNVPANALNKVFETLHGDVLREMAHDSDYLDVVNYVLLHKEGSSRFPNDTEFLAEMETRNFYNIQNKKKYLYERLVNGDSRERVDVISGFDAGTLSVEHIMPQTLSLQWKQSLGERWQTIHETWVHRIANLTLTGYNSELSNRAFIDKREAKNGFKDSGLRINKWIATREKWTEFELKERSRLLKKEFLSLWPMVATTYSGSASPNEIHAFDEEFNFTGRNIAAFTFFDTRYPVKSWVEMQVSLLRLLTELDAPALIEIAKREEFPGNYLSVVYKDGWDTINDDIFVYTGNSTQSKLNIIGAIFDELKLERSDLSFEIYQVTG